MEIVHVYSEDMGGKEVKTSNSIVRSQRQDLKLKSQEVSTSSYCLVTKEANNKRTLQTI